MYPQPHPTLLECKSFTWSRKTHVPNPTDKLACYATPTKKVEEKHQYRPRLKLEKSTCQIEEFHVFFPFAPNQLPENK